MKNTIDLEAPFGLVLNRAFIAQSGSRTLVIIVMNILVKKLWNIISGRQTEVKEQLLLYPTINCFNYCIILKGMMKDKSMLLRNMLYGN